MDSGDGLHDAAIPRPEPMPVNRLNLPDVGRSELRQGYAGVALDRARHAGRPQQFIAQMTVDELVYVAKILQQLPALEERRSHELDQRFGKVGGDVVVGERRAQSGRMRRPDDHSVRRDAQGFFFDALAAAAQHTSLAGIDESREAAFESPVHHITQRRNPKKNATLSASRLGYLNPAKSRQFRNDLDLHQ